jgi:hypothetical protein
MIKIIAILRIIYFFVNPIKLRTMKKYKKSNYMLYLKIR